MIKNAPHVVYELISEYVSLPGPADEFENSSSIYKNDTSQKEKKVKIDLSIDESEGEDQEYYDEEEEEEEKNKNRLENS